MAAISQMPNSFRFPPAFIPYSGPPVPKPKPKAPKRTVQREEALAHRQPSPSENWTDVDDILSSIGETTAIDASAEYLSLAGGNEISVNALRANCGDNHENPIEIESDTDEDGSSSSGEDEDDGLPPVSDLLQRSARPHGENAAGEPQRANIAMRHSSTRRSPTPSNDHNAYTAGAEAEGDGADDGSQGDLGKADGADKVQDARPPQSAALAIEGDGEQCEDKSRDNVDEEGFGMFGCCRRDGDDDGGAGGSGASDDATSAAGNYDISRSLQSLPFLDATYRNRKRGQEPDGSLSTKRTKLAQQPNIIPPANCAFLSEQNHGSHSVRDCDEEDGTQDDGRSHYLQATRADLCPSKQRKTGQALFYTAATTYYPRLNMHETHPMSLDGIAGTSCRGSGSKVDAIADMGHADEEIGVPTNSTDRANKAGSVNENADGDDTRPSLDDVDSQPDAPLQYAGTTAPHRLPEDSVNIPNDGSVSHRPSPALDRSNEQDVTAVRDESVVSVHQASGSEDKYDDIDRDGQGVHHLQNDRGPQPSLGSGADGKSRRPSSYSVRRPARDDKGDQRISRRVKQGRTAYLNRSDDSGDELERPASRRSPRLLRRRRVDGDRRRAAGRRLSGLPNSASLHVEVSHDREMQLGGSDKHPQTAPARVTRIIHVTIRPVSKDASILIALGRGDAVPMRYDDRVASAIETAVGHVVKLASISIDPLPPGAWLLTGLVCGPDEDGALQSLLCPQPRPQSGSVRSGDEGQQSSDGDDSSNDDGDDNGSDTSSNWRGSSQERGGNGGKDKGDEESDGLGDSSWKSRHIKGSKWEDLEDEHLRMWVAQDARPRWKAIYQRFPKRTDASVCLRGHKIRTEMAKGGEQGA